jgi:hypothetical protein
MVDSGLVTEVYNNNSVTKIFTLMKLIFCPRWQKNSFKRYRVLERMIGNKEM